MLPRPHRQKNILLFSFEIVFDDAPKCSDTVSPTDFFTFGVSSAVIRDPNLVNSQFFQFRDFRGDLRLKTEAIFLDLYALDNLTAEHLVAGLHVGQVQVGKHVGHQCQYTIAYAVPEVKHPVWLAAEESWSEYHVGAVTDDRLDQARVFVGVVLEVRVLNDD